MKINKLVLIAMGTLLSNQTYSQTNNSNDISSDDINVNSNNIEMKKNNIDQIKVGQTQYACPMHPEIISEIPGNCPICGMNLVLKDKTTSLNKDVVISKSIQQNMNISIQNPKMKMLNPKIKSFGSVKYNENEILKYHSKIAGWIESIYVKETGEEIKKGQLLYKLYSKELVVAQQDLLLTLNSTHNKKLKEKSILRLKLLGVDEETIKQIIKNKEVYYEMPFYAKKDGFISVLNIKEGSYLEPNKEILETVSLNELWFEGLVYEKDDIEIGDKIKINFENGLEINSKIDYIYPDLDKKTLGQKYRATIVKNKNLKPNMIADAEISTKRIIGLFIPKESLIQTGVMNKVVVKNNDNFVVKEVKTGFKDSENVQVIKGLTLTDVVVTSGQFLIDSEASLKGAILRLEEGNNE